MKKNISYREKLLELSKIYKIAEIQNYIKRKNLTTHQIEHILKKNNVPIPKDFNVSFFKKFFKSYFESRKRSFRFYNDTTDGVGRFLKKREKVPQIYMMILLAA